MPATNHPADDLVADELAIRNLTAAYTDAINRSAVDEAVHVYADDGVFTMMDRPGVIGRDRITEVLEATIARYSLIVQLVHSGVVHLDGDTAQSRWQVTELQFRPDGTRRFVIGRYEDDLVRTAGGWRFASRTFTARYLGAVDLSGDVIPDELPLFPLWG